MNNTNCIYHENMSLCDFNALVADITNDSVFLDKTAFYPEGGGQPSDHGKLLVNGNTYQVKDVKKDHSGLIEHILKEQPNFKIGAQVYGQVNSIRRQLNSKLHTSLHLLNSIVFTEFSEAKVTGGNISSNEDGTARMDFLLPEEIDNDQLRQLAPLLNEAISCNFPVTTKSIKRSEAIKLPGLIRTLNRDVPSSPDGMIRVVTIEGLINSSQACGGTHVNNLSEIGSISIRSVKSKGRGNRRITIFLKQ